MHLCLSPLDGKVRAFPKQLIFRVGSTDLPNLLKRLLSPLCPHIPPALSGEQKHCPAQDRGRNQERLHKGQAEPPRVSPKIQELGSWQLRATPAGDGVSPCSMRLCHSSLQGWVSQPARVSGPFRQGGWALKAGPLLCSQGALRLRANGVSHRGSHVLSGST